MGELLARGLERASGSAFGMPGGALKSRALLAAHLAGRVVDRVVVEPRKPLDLIRRAVVDAFFLETTLREFGANSMVRSRHGFFPHIFMPDFHGPHFDEALQRAALPGRGPGIVYFSVTGDCPCNCAYCFAGAGGGVRRDIGDEPVLEVARKLAELRVPLVNLSGGEPLTHFDRVVKAVRILDRGSEVRMFTGGFGLTAARLRKLRDAGLTGVFVSLDTDDAKAFDRDRGRPGAFAAATAALRLCADEGMLTFINCVVGRDRFHTTEEIVRFLRFVESVHPEVVVNFLPQLSTGRGAEAEGFREPSECHEVAERIVETGAAIGRPVSMLFGRVDTLLGCPGAGGKLLNVDIDGNVTVCVARASLGNLLEEPFERIYERYVRRCDRLKVGFFCCEVSEINEGELLEPAASHRALNDFFARNRNSDVQRSFDRFGWLAEYALREATPRAAR